MVDSKRAEEERREGGVAARAGESDASSTRGEPMSDAAHSPHRTSTRRRLILLQGASPGMSPTTPRPGLQTPKSQLQPKKTPVVSVSLAGFSTAPVLRHRTPFIAGSTLTSSSSLPGLSAREICDARKDLDSAMRCRYYGIESAHQAARTRASYEAFQAFVAAAASQQGFAASLGRRRLKWWSFVGWRERMAADRHKELMCYNAVLAARRRALQNAFEPWRGSAHVSKKLWMCATSESRRQSLQLGMQTWREAAARFITETYSTRARHRATDRFLMRSPFYRWRCRAPEIWCARISAQRYRRTVFANVITTWTREASASRLRREAAWFLPCRVLWHNFMLTRSQRVALDDALQMWALRTAREHWMRRLLTTALRSWRCFELSRAMALLVCNTVEQHGRRLITRVVWSRIHRRRLFAALLVWVDFAIGTAWSAQMDRAVVGHRAWQLRNAMGKVVASLEIARDARRRQASLIDHGLRHYDRLERKHLFGAVRYWHSKCIDATRLHLVAQRVEILFRRRKLAGAWHHFERLSSRGSGCRALERYRKRHDFLKLRQNIDGRLAVLDHNTELCQMAEACFSQNCRRHAWLTWLDMLEGQKKEVSVVNSGADRWKYCCRRRAFDRWAAARAWRLWLNSFMSERAVHARAWRQWCGFVACKVHLRGARLLARDRTLFSRRRIRFLRWVEWTAERLEKHAAERETLGRLQPFFLPPLSLLPFVSPVSETKLMKMRNETEYAL